MYDAGTVPDKLGGCFFADFIFLIVLDFDWIEETKSGGSVACKRTGNIYL